jgi:acyl-[acyl-carrier-protein]-phospholipid O-acyltransferase/long-chain-fatty-acid--[acyl-carrier-protein] ligase
MSDSLMLSRRFAPLFWCQFFSAFSDNFLKNALVFLILFAPGVEHREVLITLTAAVFIGPFFFLSGLGGQLADRFDKSIVARWVKLVEIAVAGLGVVGFAMRSIPLMFVTLFMFGVIATLFGPIKYGILPDHLKKEELPAGNALVEGATFIAILLGTMIGGLAAKEGNHPALFGAMIVVFSFACWGASLLIPRTGEGAPQLTVDPNIARSTGSLIKDLWVDARLWWGGHVTSWFWLVGAVALSLMPPLVKQVLGATEEVVTVFLAIFSISIAIGSGLAAWIAHGRIVLYPTLIGAILLAIFAVDLGIATYGVRETVSASVGTVFTSFRGIRIAIDLAGLAIAGGLFIVPSFAAVQSWAGPDKRARVVAAVNVLNAAYIVGGTLIVAALQAFGLTLPALFLVLGAANIIVAAFIWLTMGKYLENSYAA